MKSINLSTLKIMAVLTVLLLSSMITPVTKAGVTSSIGTLEGPYFKELRFKIYATSEAEVSGLLSGDVDVVDFFEAEQIPDIKPGLDAGKLATKQNAEQGMWGFSLQTERYPLNLVQFRRAIAYLCDKEKYVREGLQGLGYKLNTFLGSPGYGPWAGKTYTPFDFDPTKAAQLLDSIGFVKGADGKRIDPKTGKTMRALVIYARVEHPHRIFSARELAKQFDAVGIPYDLKEVPRSVTSAKVFLEQDYDIYTSGWGGGPDVDWLYDLFYSTSPPSQNFELFKNSTVDAALDKLKYGKTNAEVLAGAQLAQQYLSEQVPFIPLYAKAYLSPYNARLKNVVDEPWWSGVTNSLTFTVATDKTTKFGSVLNIGWTSDPQQPSPMYEINWWWDTMLNDVIYDYPIKLDPTTFAEMPWLAKSWKSESWTAPNGTPGMKITFTLNDGIKWHDGLPLTADDVVFTWTYAQKEQNPVYISYLTSFVKGETPDKLTAIAYMNTTSYWALHWVGANIPIIPKHIWQNIKDSVKYQPVSEGNLIGTGPYIFKEYKPGEYVVVTANPNYFLKPADSTLSFPKVTMTQGDTKDYTSNKALYNNKPVTNGTYTITVLKAGTTVKSFKGTAAADGSYKATLDTKDIAPGTYDMMVELVAKVGPVGLGSLDEYVLTVSEKPVDYTMYAAILAAIVVIVAAGYIVMRRRK
jgi:peptide/nickel transport system substrate-binding protein